MSNIIDANKSISLKDDLLKVRDTFLYLLRNWKKILITGVVGGLIGIGYAYFKKPLYVATLTFAVEEEKSGGGLGGALGLASQLGIDINGSAGGAFTSTNLISLMKSRLLIEKTLLDPVNIKGKNTSLVEYYIDINKIRDDKSKAHIVFPVSANRENFTLQQDSLLGVIYEDISMVNLSVAAKDKKSSLITIEVKSGDEAFSKNLAEVLAKVTSEFYVDTKSKKARNNFEILQRQTDSIRSELNRAISGVATATDQAYNLNQAYNIRRVPVSQKQVDVQANTAILTELVKNLELAKVGLRKETPLIQIIDRPILPLRKDKPRKLTSAIAFSLIFSSLVVLMMVLRRIWTNL